MPSLVHQTPWFSINNNRTSNQFWKIRLPLVVNQINHLSSIKDTCSWLWSYWIACNRYTITWFHLSSLQTVLMHSKEIHLIRWNLCLPNPEVRSLKTEAELENYFIPNSISLSAGRPNSDNTFKNLHTIDTLSKVISTLVYQSRVPSRLHIPYVVISWLLMPRSNM